MIILKSVEVNKYKCIEEPQEFVVEPQTTVFVGMNESGKTSILEALAKANYFEDDERYEFNEIHDYPRKQKKAMNKSGETPKAITLVYAIDDDLAAEIETDLDVKIASQEFSVTKYYDNSETWSVTWVKAEDFISAKAKLLKITDKSVIDELSKAKTLVELLAVTSDDEAFEEVTKELKRYYNDTKKWEQPIDKYITHNYLVPNLPKFMYYDDYYMLPSRVSLNDIKRGAIGDDAMRTAKALLELADIDIDMVLQSESFENFIAELEATQAIISEELFKYWSTNKNLEILFQIDKVERAQASNTRIVDRILDIRVKNKRSGVSLPLENRSKGFNWFFSFLVWFAKIQESTDNTYILLLDEPGLNLHAKAQNDFLHFLTDLSEKYQILYTTHSPFMIETSKLNQVRTVVEQEDGTHISESVQEKDPNTLFPLQAALGYDLAQNLFVSPKNLLVEGISDLIYLNLISGILQEDGRLGLHNDITIVPVGGADKVATFVSLLRGNELDMVCLLDTFTDQSAKQRLDNMVVKNIIKDKKIVFYHEILENDHADIEDLFDVKEYLSLYNGAMGKKIEERNIDQTKPILLQLKKINSGKDFNHYAPANFFAKNVATIQLSDSTKDNFAKLFGKINKLFK